MKTLREEIKKIDRAKLTEETDKLENANNQLAFIFNAIVDKQDEIIDRLNKIKRKS